VRKYELTIIVKPDMDATALAGVLEKVKGYIAAENGSIAKTDMWGMRRLGYPIKKYKEGQYAHFVVELDAASVARVENRLRLNEDILRHLLVIEETQPAPRPRPEAAPAVEAPSADAPVADAVETPTAS
jgi:small subunit ribosomal protein S6